MAESHVVGTHAGGLITSSVHEEDDELIFTDVMSAEAVQAIIEENRSHKQQDVGKTGPSGLGTLGARIPLPTWQAWQNEWKSVYKPYMKWHVFLKKRLNSNEYREFVFQKL